MKTLTRGELAQSSGVGIEALRFYEQKGLLEKPKRTSAGYRQYSSTTVQQIRFIKRAQELGFTLKEIKELLDLQTTSKSTCGGVRIKADQKLKEIAEKIEDLKKMQKSLKKISNCCSKGEPPGKSCLVLDCFEGNC